MLSGSYWDRRFDPNGEVKEDFLCIGSLRYRPARHCHLTETGPDGAWTVVVMGPVVRKWGFLRDRTWWPFKDYVDRFGGVIRCDPEDKVDAA